MSDKKTIEERVYNVILEFVNKEIEKEGKVDCVQIFLGAYQALLHMAESVEEPFLTNTAKSSLHAVADRYLGKSKKDEEVN